MTSILRDGERRFMALTPGFEADNSREARDIRRADEGSGKSGDLRGRGVGQEEEASGLGKLQVEGDLEGLD